MASALTAADVGVVTVGDRHHVLGVISERDIVRAVADGRDLATTTAADVAHTSIIWCDATSTVAEVGMEMMEHWVRHILVERNGKLVGIVSARDLLGVYVTADASFD